MHTLLLYSHAGMGALVLILGFANFFTSKGSSKHVLMGRIYVGAMWWICFSAFLMITFYRFSFFLMVIGVLTFYASFVGVRVIRRKKIGSEKWYDWLVSGLTVLFGIGLFSYGAYIFADSGFEVIALLSCIFGAFTFQSGFQDLLFFYRKNPMEKNWWLHQHISAIGGSYIAGVTAFAVQNSRIFLPTDYSWVAWLLPTIVLSPVLSYMIQKKKKETQLKQRPTS